MISFIFSAPSKAIGKFACRPMKKVPSRGVFRRNAGDDLFTLKCAGYKPGELIKPLDDFHSIGLR